MCACVSPPPCKATWKGDRRLLPRPSPCQSRQDHRRQKWRYPPPGDGARVRLQLSSERPQQGRLPRAVGPNDAQNGPLPAPPHASASTHAHPVQKVRTHGGQARSVGRACATGTGPHAGSPAKRITNTGRQRRKRFVGGGGAWGVGARALATQSARITVPLEWRRTRCSAGTAPPR